MNNARDLLSSPNFEVDPHNYIAGLRPYREHTFRLDGVTLGNKAVVHNYGHGGAGITMSWGCAQEVLDKVAALGGNPSATPIAVLGQGVMGLTAATLLREQQYPVTIYAKVTNCPITSMVAGGQWAPSLVEFSNTTAGRTEFERILRTSFRKFEGEIGQGFGVVRRDNYTIDRSASLDKVPHDLIPEPDRLAHLPFQQLNVPGYRYRTLLVEPPIFLRRLKQDLLANGVNFVEMNFLEENDVRDLTERVVVNCTGLGSTHIWPDANLRPLKGQLAILPPQPDLEYLFSARGYLFPRGDGVVIGGTSTKESDCCPEPSVCRHLVESMRDTFDGVFRTMMHLPRGYLIGK